MAASSSPTYTPQDLYTLACRAHDPLDAAVRFSAAFDRCFEQNVFWPRGPDIVLQRVRQSEDDYWIGSFADRVLNAFVWRVVWVNPQGLDPDSPHRNGDVAVIEDAHGEFDGWFGRHDEPQYIAVRAVMRHMDVRSRAHRAVPMLNAHEVHGIFLSLQEKRGLGEPLEDCWFSDAFLPEELVDGVPESNEHGHMRRRGGFNGETYSSRRDYLENPRWCEDLLEGDKRRKAAGDRPWRWEW